MPIKCLLRRLKTISYGLMRKQWAVSYFIGMNASKSMANCFLSVQLIMKINFEICHHS